MRARRRRWVTAALLVLGADAALLLSAGLVLGASRLLHSSAFGLVAVVLSEMASALPAGVLAGFGAILGILGAGWWQQHVFGPAFSGETDAGLPALGATLAAPVYLVLRRAARSVPEEPAAAPGSPPHRIYVARRAKVLEPLGGASTAVQESL